MVSHFLRHILKNRIFSLREPLLIYYIFGRFFEIEAAFIKNANDNFGMRLGTSKASSHLFHFYPNSSCNKFKEKYFYYLKNTLFNKI